MMQSKAAPAAVLLKDRFDRDGYMVIDSITTGEDITRIRSLLEPLFENFAALGERAMDLAGQPQSTAALKLPEINEAAVLVPELRETQAFARCRELAHELLDAPVGYLFDHAIYKPPHNDAPTGWHQDQVYSKSPIGLRSVHFWIPLQEATVDNGCLWYLPGSHLDGPIPHRAANDRTAALSSRKTGTTWVVDGVDETKAVPCPVPLGGCSLHHPLNLHYAGANQTDGWRRAWILHFGAYGKWRFFLNPKSVMSKLKGES